MDECSGLLVRDFGFKHAPLYAFKQYSASTIYSMSTSSNSSFLTPVFPASHDRSTASFAATAHFTPHLSLPSHLIFDTVQTHIAMKPPRGSLASILCSTEKESVEELNWSKRFEIIKDVSQALSYMHHDRDPPIVRRDIKSSNIMLDSELKAYISDFGTAGLVNPDSSNWSALAGTYGYIVPTANTKFPSYSPTSRKASATPSPLRTATNVNGLSSKNWRVNRAVNWDSMWPSFRPFYRNLQTKVFDPGQKAISRCSSLYIDFRI